ncbi:hypothetical protein BU17DRAFT_86873 [Hysterangium stoloniferum]|nr:hypothetical protein BU17DRAFT_86873 [Hysterangium stoloniferum]
MSLHRLTRNHHPLDLESYSYLYRNLPLDIVRLILEWAARTRHTGSILCRVSSVVFRWTVPVSYQTVVLREPHDARCFDAAIDSIRGEYYFNAVRNISLPRYGQPPSLEKCTRIKSIAIYAYDAIANYTLSLNLPKLTHLTIYDQSRYFLLNGPLSRGLTHLAVSQQFMLLIRDLTFIPLPNLTHFVTPVLTNGGPNCETIYRGVFTQLHLFPKLRVIGLMVFRVDSREAVPDTKISRRAVLRIIGLEDDVRIVMFPRRIMDEHDSWQNFCVGEQDVWELAERLLLSRVRELPPGELS